LPLGRLSSFEPHVPSLSPSGLVLPLIAREAHAVAPATVGGLFPSSSERSPKALLKRHGVLVLHFFLFRSSPGHNVAAAVSVATGLGILRRLPRLDVQIPARADLQRDRVGGAVFLLFSLFSYSGSLHRRKEPEPLCLSLLYAVSRALTAPETIVLFPTRSSFFFSHPLPRSF